MHNNTWKKERDLLSEAYNAVTETDHGNIQTALGPDEEEQEDGSIKNTKTGETVHKPKSKVNEEIGDPLGDEVSDVQPEVDVEFTREPDEVDAEIDSLKSLILNPPVDKIEEYARQGQLHVYVDMLKKKLEAAEAVKAAVRGEAE